MPTLRGKHCVFVIAIQKRKCFISQFVLLRFDQYHQYLHSLLILSFYEILNLEQYKAVVGYITTPVQKRSAISRKYYYCGWIYTIDFSCYLLLGLHALIFYSTKIRNSIVESLFCISGASTEPQENSRVELIVESDIGLLL